MREELERNEQLGSLPGDSIVSVLVPVSAESKQHLQTHKDYIQGQHTTDSEPKCFNEREGYGEILGRPPALNKSHKQTTKLYSTSALGAYLGDLFSLFSYRISLPFLESVTVSSSQVPVIGDYATVIILLALVWMGIITISFVEIRNYLQRRQRLARLAAESDILRSEERACNFSEVKSPIYLPMVSKTVGRGTQERCQDEDADIYLSDSVSDSESEIESERDDYRLY